MVKITFAAGLLVVLLKSLRKAAPHFSTLTHGRLLAVNGASSVISQLPN